MEHQKPAKLYRRNEQEEQDFQTYCSAHGIDNFVDEYSEAFIELRNFKDPRNVFVTPEVLVHGKEQGIWICYPWKRTAVQTLCEHEFDAVRLSRNNDLITPQEQTILRSKKIAIAGLNVGNPAAICMVQEGIGHAYMFADNDKLGLSNLNRFRSGLCDIGLNKAVLSARQAYEIDPYIDISIYPNGISADNLDEFLDGVDLLIEEMDNLALKILVREKARTKGIPTIMVTGNGGGCILDVERFDQEPQLEILSGNITPEVGSRVLLTSTMSPQDKLQLARDFMGPQGTLTERLYVSFEKIGISLIGIPQLAEASFLRGAVLANTARSILLGQTVNSGRYSVQLSDIWSS